MLCTILKLSYIKAEKHHFTWEVICDSIGIESPGDISLCTKHYQQVYRMLNAESDGCKSCGVLSRNSNHNFISCPDHKRVESYLWDTIAFSESIQDGDQICYPCYRFFNQMLKSDVCMLSNEDIVLELRAKNENLVHEFEYITPESSDVVECCLHKTALHACELIGSI